MATTRERLNQLLAETDAIFEDAFMTFVQTVQSDAVMAEIISRLESNDLEGALEIIRQHTASFAQQAVPIIQTAGGSYGEALVIGETAERRFWSDASARGRDHATGNARVDPGVHR